MPAAKERFTEAELRATGFSGFQTVGELRSTKLEAVPRDPGVYVVIRIDPGPPAYLAQSEGGWFKGDDPTVPTTTLKTKWVAGAHLLYVGKATRGSTGRLAGATLTRPDGSSNTIVTVDWSGVERITSNGERGRIKIEIFKWAVDRILRDGSVARTEINDEYQGRASSGVVIILAQVPLFELSDQPLTLRITGR